ncbi:MAG: hypothetical protein Fues2KO_46960 [Fuerstiella sp.]|jgi:hypothetical protein
MVAAAEHNQEPTRGAFGDALRRSHGVSLTTRELRALQWRAKYGSVGMLIRQLIGREEFEKLIRETESERRAAKAN